jgi:hypothetical protein
MYALRCQLLAEHLKARGILADPDAWQQSAGYRWMRRRHAAGQAIKQIVPEGGSFILVDDQNWSDPAGHGEVLSRRRTIPFLEKSGRYWGQPPDDATAVAEVDRLRRAGAQCIAFAWPCFWWLEHYRGLERHLREHYQCLLQDENLVVFDLKCQR